ncbi:MAG: hypothetical protein AMK73_05750 [Planctomycetes bacterium SM23_32]|nr:MAG: hypothetical protein AMK73_05750 [Planctomycetes bacterium SM23_32]
MFVNPFRQQGNWYRGNLHTHTRASDGQASVEERIRQYRNEGYDVLAITDHGVTSEVADFSTDEMLLLDGVEVSSAASGGAPFYHFVCLNVHPDATVPGSPSPNDVIAWAKKEGGESLLAHPYWSGNDAQDLLAVHGHVGVEVYNAGCRNINKACSSVHWDNMLNKGARTPGIAVDDVHSAEGQGGDLFGGWVMLKMPELSAPAVLEALRTGCHYCSCGPRVLDFGLLEGKAYVQCEPAREVHLMGANWHGLSCCARGDGLLREAQAEVDAEWKYVRAEVVDAEGRRAWTNPIYL